MFENIQNRLKKAGRLLPVALLPFAAYAQVGYAPANAVNTAGTYTDLGTSGTAITTANNDDANSAAQPIGFSFTYNGTAFTQFVLSTNGLIKLGATAPSAANLFICNVVGCTNVDPVESTDPADVNLILPFNFDLEPGTSAAEYRVVTTGTAPNRVCTIQWKNVSDKADATPSNKQYTNFSFQTKLYETTNNIEFVYGTATASTATAESRFPNVGIKGNSSASGQDLLASKTTGAGAWTTTTFITGSYPGSTHNIRNSALPDAGRTYRFVPGVAAAPANDNCATATALTVGATCTPITATNSGATASTGAPTPSATGCFTATTPISNDVWYTAVVPASGALTVTTSAITGSPVTDTGLIIYSGTCAGLTEIGCSDDATTTTLFSSAALTGLTPGATVYVRVWSFGTTPAGQFGICATAPTPAPATDAAVTVIYSLGKVSSLYGSPVAAQAVITNAGTTALTSLPVTLTVSGATTYTNTQTVASLAVGASTTVSFSYPVTATTGTNTLTVTVPADGLASNNSQTFTQAVSSNTLSYISGTTFTGGAGLTAAGNVIAVGYRTASAATVTSVTPSFAGTGTAGSTYQLLIYSAATNGQPGTVLYTSPARPRPAGVAGTITTDLVTVPNIAVNGAFFVGVKTIGADNIGFAYQTEVPLRPATFFFTTTGTTWTDINTSTLNSRLAVDVVLSTVTATNNQALAANMNLYPNPAHQSFRLDVPAGSLHNATAKLINALGQVVLTRELSLPTAGGSADFDVSRLATGVYSLQLKAGNDIVVKRVVVE